MILVGLLLRLSMFASMPIMEIDYYRYLWDGAVLANGANPYLLSPHSIAIDPDSPLQALSQSAGFIFDRINYPQLRSIYPPLTQLMFALSYNIDSWNLDAWRLLLLIAEILSLTLLIVLLGELKRSALWAAIYWWNPLVIKEAFNSAHMDSLLVPFILLSILMLLRSRPVISSALLTLAAGIKLWPLLLLPFSLRPLISKPKQLLIALIIIATLGLIVVGPLLYYGLGENSGLVGFSQDWQRNAGGFQLILAACKLIIADAGLLSPEILARLILALFLVVLVTGLNFRASAPNYQLVIRITWVIAALFLLSPTQFPWYYLWLLPLLSLYPERGLILLTALLPVYYLRFYFDARDQANVFDNYLVWIQYLPVFAVILIDRYRNYKTIQEPTGHVSE